MEIEREKVLNALARIPNLNHKYEVIVSGIGRESTAKAIVENPPFSEIIICGLILENWQLTEIVVTTSTEEVWFAA